jgi:hypothetical protein
MFFQNIKKCVLKSRFTQVGLHGWLAYGTLAQTGTWHSLLSQLFLTNLAISIPLAERSKA